MNSYYLGASLPALSFDQAPLITTEAFLDAASAQMSERDYKKLESLTILPVEGWSDSSLPGKYYAFETALRNRLARVRASALKQEADAFLHEESELFADLEGSINNALSAADPFLRERALDRLRYRQLEMLESSHQFDFDFFCAYKLKLAVIEKIRAYDAAEGRTVFDAIIDDVYDNSVNAQLNYGDHQ